jgi:hypothetical protein
MQVIVCMQVTVCPGLACKQELEFVALERAAPLMADICEPLEWSTTPWGHF